MKYFPPCFCIYCSNTPCTCNLKIDEKTVLRVTQNLIRKTSREKKLQEPMNLIRKQLHYNTAKVSGTIIQEILRKQSRRCNTRKRPETVTQNQ